MRNFIFILPNDLRRTRSRPTALFETCLLSACCLGLSRSFAVHLSGGIPMWEAICAGLICVIVAKLLDEAVRAYRLRRSKPATKGQDALRK